jgi:hypothetical protein
MQMILKENKIFQLKSFRLLRRLDKKNRKWISILRIVCLLSNSHLKKKMASAQVTSAFYFE